MNKERQPWILCVDDDDDDRFLTQQAFTSLKTEYVLQVLSSGEELFRLLEDMLEQPSLVLLDVNMPQLDGFDILARLRAQVAYYAMPILFLTTSDSEQDRQKAKLLGVTDYFVKPNFLQELKRVIAQIAKKWLME
ncbi:response regulator [Spirosoma harenae]